MRKDMATITKASDGFRQVTTAKGTCTISVYDIHLIEADETRIYPDYYQGKAMINGVERYVRTGDRHPRNANGMFYVGEEV